jgi:hypothetical protein
MYDRLVPVSEDARDVASQPATSIRSPVQMGSTDAAPLPRFIQLPRDDTTHAPPSHRRRPGLLLGRNFPIEASVPGAEEEANR